MEALADADRPRAYLDDAYPALPARLQPAGRALTLAAGKRARIRAAAARRILTATLAGGLAQASATGVRITAGTDAGNNYTPHGWSLHRELNLLRQARLDAETVHRGAHEQSLIPAVGPHSSRRVPPSRFRPPVYLAI